MRKEKQPIQSLHLQKKKYMQSRKMWKGDKGKRQKTKKSVCQSRELLCHISPLQLFTVIQDLFPLIQESTVRNIQPGLETKEAWRECQRPGVKDSRATEEVALGHW